VVLKLSTSGQRTGYTARIKGTLVVQLRALARSELSDRPIQGAKSAEDNHFEVSRSYDAHRDIQPAQTLATWPIQDRSAPTEPPGAKPYESSFAQMHLAMQDTGVAPNPSPLVICSFTPPISKRELKLTLQADIKQVLTQ
jgi:hypothetical protein